MRRVIKLVVLGALAVAIMLLTPVEAHADTTPLNLWVDASSGSDENPGTESAPLVTLDKASEIACGSAACPDNGVPVTVYVAGVLGPSQWWYTSTAGVTIKPWHDTFTINADGAHTGLSIRRKVHRDCDKNSGVTVQGVAVTGATRIGISVSGSYKTVNNIDVTDCALRGTRITGTLVKNMGTTFGTPDFAWGAYMASHAPGTNFSDVAADSIANEKPYNLHPHGAYITASPGVSIEGSRWTNISGTAIRVRHGSHNLTVNDVYTWRAGGMATFDDWYKRPGYYAKAEYRSYGMEVTGWTGRYMYPQGLTGRSVTLCVDLSPCPTSRISVL